MERFFPSRVIKTLQGSSWCHVTHDNFRQYMSRDTRRTMERFFPSRVIKSLQGPSTKIDLLHFDEFFIPVTELQLNNEF